MSFKRLDARTALPCNRLQKEYPLILNSIFIFIESLFGKSTVDEVSLGSTKRTRDSKTEGILTLILVPDILTLILLRLVRLTMRLSIKL